MDNAAHANQVAANDNDQPSQPPLTIGARPASIVALLAMPDDTDIDCTFPPLAGPIWHPADLTGSRGGRYCPNQIEAAFTIRVGGKTSVIPVKNI
jgi:hypothetical protein